MPRCALSTDIGHIQKPYWLLIVVALILMVAGKETFRGYLADLESHGKESLF